MRRDALANRPGGAKRRFVKAAEASACGKPRVARARGATPLSGRSAGDGGRPVAGRLMAGASPSTGGRGIWERQGGETERSGAVVRGGGERLIGEKYALRISRSEKPGIQESFSTSEIGL